MTTPTMAEQLVPDEVWAAIQPLLPPKRPHPKGGRPWIDEVNDEGVDRIRVLLVHGLDHRAGDVGTAVVT